MGNDYFFVFGGDEYVGVVRNGRIFLMGMQVYIVFAMAKQRTKPAVKIAENKMQQDLKKQNRAIKVRHIVPCRCYCKATLNGLQNEGEYFRVLSYSDYFGEKVVGKTINAWENEKKHKLIYGDGPGCGM